MRPRDDVLDRWRQAARHALPGADADLVEEVATHLADRWTAVRASTGSDAAADAAARLDLDDWQGRAHGPSPAISSAPAWRGLAAGLGLDIRSAQRRLAVRPIQAAGAAVLVAIAVAASVAVFMIAFGILGRPLPYPAADRLVTLWQLTRGDMTQISYPDFDDLRKTGSFDLSAAMSAGVGTLAVDDPGAADRVQVVEAEPALLTMMGAVPQLGRLLTAEDGTRPFALISHRLWQTRFHADPAVIGRPFTLSGRAYSVVGVLPAGLDLELPVTEGFTLTHADIWLGFDQTFSFVTRRDVSAYEAIARLAPGVTIDELRRRAEMTAAVLQRDFPATNAGREFRVIPLRERLTGSAVRPIALACAGAAIVLAIALANLTTLGLGRLSARQAELAVRRSLGASAWRVARQVVIDELPVALAGGAAGLALGATIARTVASAPAAHLPRPDAIALDGGVALWAVATAAILWLLPPLAALRLVGRARWLNAGARVVGAAARRTRRVLLAAEVALALVLACGAALLALALGRLVAVDPGFATSGVLTMRVSAYGGPYPTKADVTAFFGRLRAAVATVPGVDRLSAASSLPLSGQGSMTSLMSAEQPLPPAARLSAAWAFVTPGMFQAAGIPILQGRDFSDADVDRSPHVTVISHSAARALFGDGNPIGRRVAVGGGETDGDWHEVIGVVGDVRRFALSDDPAPGVYDLLGQHWGRTMYLIVRARPGLDAGSLEPLVRRAIAGVNSDAPVFEVATMEALVDRSAAPRRLAAALGAGLAVTALVLAWLGTFAVVACSVAERIRELGVRIALGATRAQVLRLILGEALVTAAAGCAGGMIASGIAARLLAGQLFGVRPADTALLVPALAAAVSLASVLAAWWPARRATLADPLAALRAAGE